MSAAPRDACTWQWAREMGTQVEWGRVEIHGHKGGSQEAVGVVMVRKLEDASRHLDSVPLLAETARSFPGRPNPK